MYVFVRVAYCVVVSKRVSNGERGQGAKDVVIRVIVPLTGITASCRMVFRIRSAQLK